MVQTTSTFLLEGISDPHNDVAWEMFSTLYRPMILAFGRRLGLQEADAEDLAQEALLAVRRAFPRYDRSRGRFRSWLFGVVRRTGLHLIKRLYDREGQLPDGSRTGGSSGIRDPRGSDLEMVWEEEWRQFVWSVLRKSAAHRFEPHVLQAFELTVRQQMSAKAVAESLHVTIEVVRSAKCRVLAHLRRTAAELDLGDCLRS